MFSESKEDGLNFINLKILRIEKIDIDQTGVKFPFFHIDKPEIKFHFLKINFQVVMQPPMVSDLNGSY